MGDHRVGRRHPTPEQLRAFLADPVMGRLNRRIQRAAVLSVLAGSSLVFASLAVALPRLSPSTPGGVVSVVLFVVYLGVSVPAGRRRGERHGAVVSGWFLEDREPTPAERAAMLHYPLRIAFEVLSGWLGAALLFGVLIAKPLGAGAQAGILVAITIVLGGLTSSAFVTFFCLRLLRPIVARALAGTLPEHQAPLALRGRLLLAWSLGSGIPLVALIVVTLLAPDLDRVRIDAVVCLLGGGALVAGALVIRAAASTITVPVGEVAAALSSVERGDLDVSVPVDDPGEIGVLQQGVNRMTEALRERARVRDLFGRHVGADVAALALTEATSSLGGELCDVSVLAIDVAGSTTIAEEQPPDDVVAMLNALFAAVVREVSAEGGWVNKFEGDGALCIFGAPTSQPDHAQRALRAGRRLRNAVEQLRSEHPVLVAGIGVSSGTVVAGNVGAEERYEFTVIGNPVNEAARLCDAAKRHPARLLASGAAIAVAAQEAGAWELDGIVTLRGHRAATEVHRPRGTPVANPAEEPMHPRHARVAGGSPEDAYSPG
jgi:adenylate cyclase